MANRKRDSEGKFASKGMTGPHRDNPWTSAAIAAGAAGIGAFLWSKRSQIGEAIDSGMEKLDELKAERFGSGEERSQAENSEEARTLKETGAKATPETSKQGAKAGAKVLA